VEESRNKSLVSLVEVSGSSLCARGSAMRLRLRRLPTCRVRLRTALKAPTRRVQEERFALPKTGGFSPHATTK
jgi:hypothetical protein